MSFHNTLTPFLGEEATEYAPEYETTTEFMNAKFQEVLDNTVANKETIDKTIRTYKSLTEINSTFTESTPLVDVITAMKNNSMAMYEILGTQGVYPDLYCLVTINKINNNRNRVEATDMYGKKKWLTNYHTTNNPNCAWQKLVTQEKTEITASMLKNSWGLKNDYASDIFKTGDKISVDLVLTGGTLTANTVICEGLPTITKDILLQVQSNTGQTYMGTYKTNGSIVLLNTLASATFYYMHN